MYGLGRFVCLHWSYNVSHFCSLYHQKRKLINLVNNQLPIFLEFCFFLLSCGETPTNL